MVALYLDILALAFVEIGGKVKLFEVLYSACRVDRIANVSNRI
jgi:hypothetical protein